MKKIWILSILVLAALACSISSAVTPTPSVPTAISAAPSPTVTAVAADPSFVCEVNVDALNMRSCESYECESVGEWSIRGQRLLVTKVGQNGGWYYSAEYQAWFLGKYCDVVK